LKSRRKGLLLLLLLGHGLTRERYEGKERERMREREKATRETINKLEIEREKGHHPFSLAEYLFSSDSSDLPCLGFSNAKKFHRRGEGEGGRR